MISFSQIPATLLTPGTYVEFDTSKMQSGLPRAKVRSLLFGQKLAAGTAAAGVLVQVQSLAHAKQLFGQGSMLAGIAAGYFDNDATTEVWALPTADSGAGVAATGTLVLAGTATAAGTLKLMAADQRVPVGITSGMTSVQAATAVAAAINAYPDLPVTAAAAASTVTVTARHKGVESNGLYFGVNYDQGDVTPTGLTTTFTAIGGVVAGAGNPDASTLIAALGDQSFQTIVWPWNDSANMTVIETALADRASALKMNYGEAYVFNPAIYSGLITAAALRNSPYAAVAGMKASPSPSWRIAAAIASQVSYSANIDPGRPFNTLVLTGILAPAATDQFTRQERELLLEAGISTLLVNASGQVAIERMITTYKTNAQGLADTGLRDLNAILLLYYLSWSLQARILSRFPRYKLGKDGGNYAPGQAIATPSTIKAEIVALAKDWEQAALIEDIDQFTDDLRVERDDSDVDRVNVFIRPDLINSFQVLAALIQPIA